MPDSILSESALSDWAASKDRDMCTIEASKYSLQSSNRLVAISNHTEYLLEFGRIVDHLIFRDIELVNNIGR